MTKYAKETTLGIVVTILAGIAIVFIVISISEDKIEQRYRKLAPKVQFYYMIGHSDKGEDKPRRDIREEKDHGLSTLDLLICQGSYSHGHLDAEKGIEPVKDYMKYVRSLISE